MKGGESPQRVAEAEREGHVAANAQCAHHAEMHRVWCIRVAVEEGELAKEGVGKLVLRRRAWGRVRVRIGRAARHAQVGGAEEHRWRVSRVLNVAKTRRHILASRIEPE